MDFKCGDVKICESDDGFVDIEVPQELLIPSFEDPINSIVESTYPKLLENYKNKELLQYRVILASTLGFVDKINDYVLDLILGTKM